MTVAKAEGDAIPAPRTARAEGRSEASTPHALSGQSIGAAPTKAYDAPIAAGAAQSEKLTVAEVCAELSVSRSTFYYWRQTGKAPRCIKLPNGEVRIRRADLDAWLDRCAELP